MHSNFIINLPYSIYVHTNYLSQFHHTFLSLLYLPPFLSLYLSICLSYLYISLSPSLSISHIYSIYLSLSRIYPSLLSPPLSLCPSLISFIYLSLSLSIHLSYLFSLHQPSPNLRLVTYAKFLTTTAPSTTP